MNQFVESLKRLYANGKISRAKLDYFLRTNKISEEDMAYIIGDKAGS